MCPDFWEERKNLFERLKDSAEVFEGADRTIDYFCGDFRVFCGNLNKGCKITRPSCPAYAANMPAYGIDGKVRKLI